MKRILSLALLCAFGVGYIGAHHEKIADLVEFAHAIKDKTVTFPAELTQKWHEFHAEKLRMHAHHIRQVAKQLPLLKKRQYLRIAAQLSNIADEIEVLPAVSFEETFTHPKIMLGLKAKKAELMGEKLDQIGRQLHMPKLVAKAEEIQKWGEELKEALKKSECPRSLEGDHHGVEGVRPMELVEVEGSDDECEDTDEGSDDYDDEGEETPAESEDVDDDSDDESEEEATPATK